MATFDAVKARQVVFQVHLWVALILCIPLVLALTFLVMYALGIELQRISLGALIIALGLLVDDAINNTAIELELAYKLAGLEGNNFSLTWNFYEVYLPRPRIPITGPGGVQASFNWQGVYDDGLSKSATVVLKNDVATYP